MPQVTGAMNSRNAVVSYTTNGSTWNAVQGETASIEWDDPEVEISEQYTGDSPNPIVLTGNNQAGSATITVVYSAASTLRSAAITARDAGTQFDVRVDPNGTSTGRPRITTTGGRVMQVANPSIDFTSADALKFEIKIRYASTADSVQA